MFSFYDLHVKNIFSNSDNLYVFSTLFKHKVTKVEVLFLIAFYFKKCIKTKVDFCLPGGIVLDERND